MSDPGQAMTWGGAAMLLVGFVLWPLLKALFAQILKQNDAQNQRVEARLEEFLKQVSLQFKDVATEIRGLARSLDKHDARADLAETRITDLQARCGELHTKQVDQSGKVEHLEGRFSSVMREWKSLREKMGLK